MLTAIICIGVGIIVVLSIVGIATLMIYFENKDEHDKAEIRTDMANSDILKAYLHYKRCIESLLIAVYTDLIIAEDITSPNLKKFIEDITALDLMSPELKGLFKAIDGEFRVANKGGENV